MRPDKDQPFYHLLAENADTEYIAYVSEQNLVPIFPTSRLRHPQVPELFEDLKRRHLPLPLRARALIGSRFAELEKKKAALRGAAFDLCAFECGGRRRLLAAARSLWRGRGGGRAAAAGACAAGPAARFLLLLASAALLASSIWR